MTYDDALKFIHSRRHGGPDLRRMERILERLGSPERELSFVHVAGTNGKGSVCAYLGEILRRSGYRTGLFTSPFVRRFNERIRVDGADIPDGELAAETERVMGVLEELGEDPAEFELVTVIALSYFRRAGCGIVVLEVGMGGRNDATNVIPESEVSVITSIGLDHTRYLGGTVEEIAAVKAGIVKEGGRCAVCRDVGGVIESVCRERGARFTPLDTGGIRVKSRGLWGTEFDFGEYRGLRIPLLGPRQPENAALAVTAAEILGSRGWRITPESVAEGLERVEWPGRFELLRRDPAVILDGGHNPQAVESAVEGLEEYFPGKKAVFVLGVMVDKDVEGITARLRPAAEYFVCVQPPVPRAMGAEALADLIRAGGSRAEAAESIAGGVERAMELAGRDGVVCVLGSLYILEEARRAACRAR